MLRLILIAAITFAGLSYGETAEQLRVRIAAKPGVISCNWAQGAQPASIPNHGTLYRGILEWWYIENATMKKGSGEVGIVDLGTETEAAYWMIVTPAIDAPVVDTKYLTSRTANGWAALTGVQQKTAIQDFCNAVYAAASPGAGAIREFDVQPTSGSIVKVSGYFDLGTTWERQTWYIRLIDPNGSVAAPYSNIEFQKVITTQESAP